MFKVVIPWALGTPPVDPRVVRLSFPKEITSRMIVQAIEKVL
jgi:hypothetical protein